MGLIRLYLHEGKLIIPTVCETEAGFFVDQGPVKVTGIKDKEKLKQTIYKALTTSNKRIPTPDAADEPGSIILERLCIDTWTEFEKKATLYTVHLGCRYTTVHVTGKGNDGMWTNTEGSKREFDRRAPADWVAQAIIEDIARQNMPRVEPAKPMLLLPGPSDKS